MQTAGYVNHLQRECVLVSTGRRGCRGHRFVFTTTVAGTGPLREPPRPYSRAIGSVRAASKLLSQRGTGRISAAPDRSGPDNSAVSVDLMTAGAGRGAEEERFTGRCVTTCPPGARWSLVSVRQNFSGMSTSRQISASVEGGESGRFACRDTAANRTKDVSRSGVAVGTCRWLTMCGPAIGPLSQDAPMARLADLVSRDPGRQRPTAASPANGLAGQWRLPGNDNAHGGERAWLRCKQSHAGGRIRCRLVRFRGETSIQQSEISIQQSANTSALLSSLVSCLLDSCAPVSRSSPRRTGVEESLGSHACSCFTPYSCHRRERRIGAGVSAPHA